jgi:F-type H+-transporting ATPase subunit b
MLNLDPGMMIWGWATFIVLLILLYKVAWKPILSTIDKRENTIQDSLDNAKNAQDEAETLLAKHEEMIKSAEMEAQKLIKENRELAEKSKQDILDQAQKTAQDLVEKAKADIEKEKEAALATLRTEVADLAIGATRKIIGESLDEAKHREMIDEFVQKIPDTNKH